MGESDSRSKNAKPLSKSLGIWKLRNYPYSITIQAVEKVWFVRVWMAPASIKRKVGSIQHERLSDSMCPKRSHLKAIIHLLDFTPWCLNVLTRFNMAKNPLIEWSEGV
jgi:hypothetical protein